MTVRARTRERGEGTLKSARRNRTGDGIGLDDPPSILVHLHPAAHNGRFPLRAVSLAGST